jgi:hypothetical protein
MGSGEADGAFLGVLTLLALADVSRETLGKKRGASGWIDRHNSRHSLNPMLRSPSPADSSISRCSGVSVRLKTRVSCLHGLGISVG